MPLIIEGGRVPTRWAEKKRSGAVVAIDRYIKRRECVSIALINNMPDAALEDTELQFFNLLDIASGDVPVLIKLCSLTGVPRTERGQRHLNDFYFGLDELWNNRFDGVIVTGTEPRQPDLRQEPYWAHLTNVLDWAERNTASTVLSCLAAHAGVLHSDGIQRHRLPDKQFGVFESAKTSEHPLTRQAPPLVRFPHSRWNEVQENCADRVRLRGAYKVRSGWGRRICEAKEEEPVRPFPGPSGVQGGDIVEGIPPRHKEIFAGRAGHLPYDAARILRRNRGQGSGRVSTNGSRGSA